MTNTENFTEFLRRSLADKTNRNRNYSLRSFARDIGMSPAQLSLCLNGKKGVSPQAAMQIAKKLGLNNEETEHLILLAEAQSARSEVKRNIAKQKLIDKKQKEEPQNLSMDLFQAISEWQHYAILELASLPNFHAEPEWIAKRLDISKYDAELSLTRLKKLQLLIETPKGWIPSNDTSVSPSGIPSPAIRKHHHQVLQKADAALEFTPIEERDFSSITLTFAPNEIDEARKFLKKFRREFAERFGESKSDSHRIYALGIQFFPMDKFIKKGDEK